MYMFSNLCIGQGMHLFVGSQYWQLDKGCLKDMVYFLILPFQALALGMNCFLKMRCI